MLNQQVNKIKSYYYYYYYYYYYRLNYLRRNRIFYMICVTHSAGFLTNRRAVCYTRMTYHKHAGNCRITVNEFWLASHSSNYSFSGLYCAVCSLRLSVTSSLAQRQRCKTQHCPGPWLNSGSWRVLLVWLFLNITNILRLTPVFRPSLSDCLSWSDTRKHNSNAIIKCAFKF
jgi:hypothetical protein